MNKDQLFIISPKVRPRRPQMKLVGNMFKINTRKLVLQQHRVKLPVTGNREFPLRQSGGNCKSMKVIFSTDTASRVRNPQAKSGWRLAEYYEGIALHSLLTFFPRHFPRAA